jgi:phosphocarrier protein
MSPRAEVEITHPTGLHARPAVKLTKLSKTFPAVIRLRKAPDGDWVDA